MSVLSDNIQKQRRALHMTQEELAVKLGYRTRSSIHKIEKGLSDIPQAKLQAFADALETTVPELLGWDSSQWKDFSQGRRESGVSLTTMEEELDLPKSTLTAWENGEVPAAQGQLETLRKVLALVVNHQENQIQTSIARLVPQLLQLCPEKLEEVEKFVQYQLALQKLEE